MELSKNKGQSGDLLPQYSPRQLLVIELLAKRSEELSKRYKAIIIAIKNNHNPERLVQAAHSARFLIRHLYKINPEAPKFQDPKNPLGSIAKFAERWNDAKGANGIFTAGKDLITYYESTKNTLGNQWVNLFKLEDLSGMAGEEHLEPLVKSLRKVMNQFDVIAHYDNNSAPLSMFESNLYELESILIGLLSQHFDLLPEVEKLLKIENPIEKDLKELNSLRSKPRLFENFFKNINHLGWFLPLSKGGYFRNPVKAKIWTDGGKSAPLWPQCAFLKKCASKYPKEVVDIIIKAQETDNWNVILEFAEISLLVPTDYSKKLVDCKTDTWIKEHSFTNLPDVLSELGIKLANDGKKEAIKLTKQLLNLRRESSILIEDEVSRISKSDRAIACFEHLHYQRILKNLIPALLKYNPKKTIDLICHALNNGIDLQLPDRTKDKRNDGLAVFRPTIEPNKDNNYGNPFINSLIDCLRDSLIEINKVNSSKIKDCLNMLRWKKPNIVPRPYIFLRIELYFLSLYPKNQINRIEEIIKDREIINCIAVEYEFDKLLTTSFEHLSQNDQEKYLNIVDDGPTDDG